MKHLNLRIAIVIALLLGSFSFAAGSDNGAPPNPNQKPTATPGDAEIQRSLEEIKASMLKLTDAIAKRVLDPANQNAATQYDFARASANEIIKMVVRANETDRLIDSTGKVWTKSQLVEIFEERLLNANVAREVAIKKGFLAKVIYRDFGGFFDFVEKNTLKSIESSDKDALVKQMIYDGITDHALGQTRESLYFASWATFTDPKVEAEYLKHFEDLKVRYAAVLRVIESNPAAVAAYEAQTHQPFSSLKLPLKTRKHMSTAEFFEVSCRRLLKD